LNLGEESTKRLPADHTSTRDFKVIIGARDRTKDLLIRRTITPAQTNQNVKLAGWRRTGKGSL
jgi:hypothetical protein